MNAIREITRVRPGGSVEVRNPALRAGDDVEVIVLLPAKKEGGPGEPYGFLKLLEEANLEGPRDWSAKLDDYLYHGRSYDGKPA